MVCETLIYEVRQLGLEKECYYLIVHSIHHTATFLHRDTASSIKRQAFITLTALMAQRTPARSQQVGAGGATGVCTQLIVTSCWARQSCKDRQSEVKLLFMQASHWQWSKKKKWSKKVRIKKVQKNAEMPFFWHQYLCL